MSQSQLSPREEKFHFRVQTISIFFGLLSLIFVVGRKDQQLSQIADITKDLTAATTNLSSDTAVVKTDLINIKERLVRLENKAWRP